MKALVKFMVYVCIPVGAALALLKLASHLLHWVSPEVVGGTLGLMLGALFFGELKQESIGKFYEAVAAASLKTSELESLNRSIIKKIRSIRWLFLISNGVKLVGGAAALYLAKEKVGEGHLRTAFIVSAECLVIASILFSRLWCEVSKSEDLLIKFRQDALVKERREEFVGKIKGEASLTDDPATRSFRAEPRPARAGSFGQ